MLSRRYRHNLVFHPQGHQQTNIVFRKNLTMSWNATMIPVQQSSTSFSSLLIGSGREIEGERILKRFVPGLFARTRISRFAGDYFHSTRPSSFNLLAFFWLHYWSDTQL